ncbi:type I 3-dehydroquinate dehydratase [Candidatus Micrarchaeota archaeon]|nr:type I 3-dehydroquinate dehydratase [Candidatus Micrarchaeota archaeon]
MNIALVGMMGSGKSRVGKEIAHSLGFGFADTDRMVEELEGEGIAQIFQRSGEEGFRISESAMVGQAAGLEDTVIACGGGAVENDENMRILLENCIVFHLSCTPALAAQRVEKDSVRPLLAGKGAVGVLTQLLERREANYKRAHFKVDANEDVKKTMGEVKRILSREVELCAVVTARGAKAAKGQVAQAAREGAKMVELRLDLTGCSAAEAGELASECRRLRLQSIATCREGNEGGKFEGSTQEKIELLAGAASNGASFIDCEIAQKDAVAKAGEIARANRCKLIASMHEMEGTPDAKMVESIMHEQMKVADVGKIACNVEKEGCGALMRALGKASEMKFPLIASPMGHNSIAARVACGLAGSRFVFGFVGMPSLEGQPSFRELKSAKEKFAALESD